MRPALKALTAHLAVAALLGGVASGVAQAQSEDEARARGHFEAASSYFEEGEYEDALREFARAYELSHRPGLLYNIGLAHERLGDYAEAARYLAQYLRDETADIPNRTALEHRVEALQRRAESETSEASEAAASATEPTASSSEPAATSDSSGTDLSVPAIASFAVGGAGLVLFAVAGGLALDGYGSLDSGCGASRSCTEDDVAGVRLAAGLADAGIALAAVGVAVGIVLLLVSDPGSSDQAALQVAPFASTASAGVVVGGAL